MGDYIIQGSWETVLLTMESRPIVVFLCCGLPFDKKDVSFTRVQRNSPSPVKRLKILLKIFEMLLLRIAPRLTTASDTS